MTKRNMFISYDHTQDQDVVDDIIRSFREDYVFYLDESHERRGDGNNAGHLSDQCMNAIESSSVILVVVGEGTDERMFVDWEIRQSLFREHGLFGIVRQGILLEEAGVPARLQDNISTGYGSLYAFPESAENLRTMVRTATQVDRSKIDNARPRMTAGG